jgi:hypothetical protein
MKLKYIPNETKLKLAGGLVSTVLGLITLTTVMTPIPQVTEQNLEVSRLNGRADFTIAPAPYKDHLTNFVANPLIILGLISLISGGVDVAKQFNNEGVKGGNESQKKYQPINHNSNSSRQVNNPSGFVNNQSVPPVVSTSTSKVNEPISDIDFAEEDPLDSFFNTDADADESITQPLDDEKEFTATEPYKVFSAPERLKVNSKQNQDGYLNAHSEKIGQSVLDSLYGSNRSTLIIGGTGAGKSVTVSYLLSKLFEYYPEVEVYVVAQKNDSFRGLNKMGRVTVFDFEKLDKTIETIDQVYEFYKERRQLPEHLRKELPPVRLFLADWLSINNSLMQLSSHPTVKASNYLIKLADLVLNGRDFNVCLTADLQSYNLEAIGIKADKNIRTNFNLVGLGNYYTDKFQQVTESYGVVESMIQSQYIIPDKNERERLLSDFYNIKPVSKQYERPIIFTKTEPARVGLLPNLMSYKDEPNVPEEELVLEADYTSKDMHQVDNLISNENVVQFPVAQNM